MKLSSMILCTTAILLSTNVVAQQRSEKEMAQIAADFLTSKATRAAVQIQKIESTPELSIYTRAGGGWVIVSGDERTRGAILAYSNDGQFDLESETVRDWVGGYREQIRSLTDVRADEGPVSPGTPVVGPLITAKWNQLGPYKLHTPICISEYQGRTYTSHYPAGCVATAIAQIMNYWQWPKRGQGEHTDIHYPSATVDFSQSEYDWDNMLDNYIESYSEEIFDNDSNLVDTKYYGNWTDTQISAVAKLMYDCGVALDSQYGDEGGTSAYSYNAPKALCAYFDYSTDARHLERNQYQGDWNALLRSELDAGRPMCYGGNAGDSSPGHSFVCDGYDDQGYFHFNFGGSGLDDGYYLTSAITPSSDNFTSNQHIVYGIHPAGQDDKVIYSDGLYYRKYNDGLECFATENIGPDGYVNVPDKVNDIPVTSIAECAFYNNPNLKSLEIGDNMKTICDYAFALTAISDLVLPSSLTWMGECSFRGCYNLKSITFPESLKNIGVGAFAECLSLESVEIPNWIETIDFAAFDACDSLKSVVIGSGVKTIADAAFAENPMLTSVTCLATTPPTCDDSRFGGVFKQTNISKATLYIPKGRKMTYQFANPWKGFGTIKEVNPTGVEVPELTKPTDEYYLNSRIRIVDGKKYLVR